MNFIYDIVDDIVPTSDFISSNGENVFISQSYCSNKLFFIHQNIRSLRENFASLVSHLESFVCIPDFIFISEIWIYDFELSDYSLPGFNFFAKTNENYASGGVGCFVKQDYDCFISNLHFLSADILKFSFKINNDVYVILCVYRFHRYNVSVFMEEFSNLLESEKSKNLIILGDFNINILELSDTVTNYLALLASHGLISLIDESTRFRSGKCLDHIYVRFSNISLSSCEKCVFDFRITDHSMTGLLVSISREDKRDSFKSLIYVTKIDSTKLKSILCFESFLEVYVYASLLNAMIFS